jgi:hypothetical protein
MEKVAGVRRVRDAPAAAGAGLLKSEAQALRGEWSENRRLEEGELESTAAALRGQRNQGGEKGDGEVLCISSIQHPAACILRVSQVSVWWWPVTAFFPFQNPYIRSTNVRST